MKAFKSRVGLSAVCTLIFAGACASLPRDVAQGVVNRWSEPSAVAGRELLDEYGTPDDVTPRRLTWNHRGVWKRTEVWNRKPVYLSPVDLAVMKQTVDYPLTYPQAGELLAFSDSIEVDLDKGELSSRSSREDINYLTMNLADEIIRGDKTVAQAQMEFMRQLRLAASGKVTPYMTGLLFPQER
ncbi:MAG TPA: hypothetical protein VN915_13985 [Elusimicrobiota bacterium]|nr:hypothetical protein [Elusimicrobiota bacterium]